MTDSRAHPPRGIWTDGENVAILGTMTASITDLRRRTRELIDELKSGNEVRIQSHGHPVAGPISDYEPNPLPDEAAYAVRKEMFARILSLPQGPIDPTDIILDDRRRKTDDVL